MTVKLLTEHHFEFLSLTGGCRGSSESTLDKMTQLLEITFHCLVMLEKTFFLRGHLLLSADLPLALQNSLDPDQARQKVGPSLLYNYNDIIYLYMHIVA